MIHLYYLPEPEKDRWIYGDRWIRPYIRRLLRGKPRPGGVDKVYLNLVEGLKRIAYPFTHNQDIRKLNEGDRILVLGRGMQALESFRKGPAFVAGIGLFTHPKEVPNFHKDYPVLAYLSHSEWVNEFCKAYYGDICKIWPAGVDTLKYAPSPDTLKDIDFLVYDKLNFNREKEEKRILYPILEELSKRGFRYEQVRYGNYYPNDYKVLLKRSKYFLFLSPHESQGLACQEAMASGLPVLAFNEKKIRDPYYIRLGSENLSTSSIPWFTAECGTSFSNEIDFPAALTKFISGSERGYFHPEKYIQQEFSLEASAHKLILLMESIYAQSNK